MSRAICSICMVLLALPALIAATGDDAAMKLADQVMKASGGDHWATVTRIRFTFNVIGADGKPAMQATHDWDVRAGSDTVSWNGKTVTVDLAGNHDSDEAKQAYQRWVNDSYWLLAPLKVKDGGVMLESKGQQEIDGKTYDVLHLHFEAVGLTPGDQYNWYIDPQTHLLMRWDYMPTPDKKVSGTWDNYQEFGGLKLATDHQFGDKRITFTDVAVETK